MNSKAYAVHAVHCDHRGSDEEVYQDLKRATAPLSRAWAKLERASRITIKFNQAFPPPRRRTLDGALLDIIDYRVARATLRLLRERTNADLLCTEISVYHRDGFDAETCNSLLPLLREYDVPLIDGNEPPVRTYAVPGGGQMFSQYLLPESVVDTDAFVSVQMMKSHVFMGVTLSLKNLFGLAPQPPFGRARQYFHHFIRLPHILVDLGRLIEPTLNILDGLVGQSGREWGGDGRICDTLVAGDQTVATDACGAYLMGFHPLGDWPDQPFVRERNALRIANDVGFGTADLTRIDFQSEVGAPLASFRTEVTDPPELVMAWRRSTCEQALWYRDHMREFVAKYAGEYILLQDGVVRWHDTESALGASRRPLAGPTTARAMFLKLVDPDEAEGEHFEVYEQELKRLAEMESQ